LPNHSNFTEGFWNRKKNANCRKIFDLIEVALF